MYLITTRGQGVCRGCDHTIPEGGLCVSEAPAAIHELENVQMGAFRYFHAACAECLSDKSCYQVYASRQTTIVAQQDTDCAYCGHSIYAGWPAFYDSFFGWDQETGIEDTRQAGQGLSALRAGHFNRASSFRDLSIPLKLKLMRAGLGGGRGIRGYAQAERLYNSSVPSQVRNLGESAVWKFVEGKQASHVESVANAPGKGMSLGNIVWESVSSNLSRGSRNMSRIECLGASVKNGARSAGIVAKGAAVNAGRGAVFASILEAPVSVAEKAIQVSKGRKSRREAAKDVAKDVGKAGVVGGVVAGGVTVVGALGASSVIASAAPVVVPLGLGMFAFSSARRIRRAMSDDSEENTLRRIHLRFHVERPDSEAGVSCYEAFASESTA